MGEERGTIAFFTTYRPPVPLDIYSSPYQPTKSSEETIMTDGEHYNYNGKVIPPRSLKIILKRIKSQKLTTTATEADIDAERVTGLIFVSERTNHLETLHIGIKFHDKGGKFEAFNFAELYGTFKGTRLEDNGCIAGENGEYLVYVSTKDDPKKDHQPWNAVFRTHLVDGTTIRLSRTGFGGHDLSSAASPSGKLVAMATYQRAGGWKGECEDLRTDISIVNVDKTNRRPPVVINGGWPSWASDNVLFFHRNINTPDNAKTRWVVFQLDLRTSKETRMTPEDINSITPAAINETTVAVTTLRNRDYDIGNPEKEREISQYRHIEIFNINGDPAIKVTEMVRPRADHFSPFVYTDKARGMRIGYHRCRIEDPEAYRVVGQKFDKLQAPDTEKIGLVRLSGVFPSFSPDGSKLAFVDNEFKALWVADKDGLFIVYETAGANNIFAPVWNSNKDIDTIYFSSGNAFSARSPVDIVMIQDVCKEPRVKKGGDFLTEGYNNAFPFTNPQGTKIVFRSTRDHDDDGKIYKNLFIMDAINGEDDITRLTNGKWIDTHPQWSPNGKWIAFASNRFNPDAKPAAGLPDGGFFAIYLAMADEPNFTPIKVIDSGFLSPGKLFPGHCVHPCFSPDGDSLVFAADLAAVSVDPITIPLFVHSVRPYGDIFLLNLKMDDIKKNANIKKYIRLTHSRYEASTASWTRFSTKDPYAKWNLLIDGNDKRKNYAPACPYMTVNGGESIHMTGHLTFGGNRCC